MVKCDHITTILVLCRGAELVGNGQVAGEKRRGEEKGRREGLVRSSAARLGCEMGIIILDYSLFGIE